MESNLPPKEPSSGRDATEVLSFLLMAAHWAGTILSAGALGLLFLRSVLRIETYWDSVLYHIPFAAKRAGLGVPYEMTPFHQNLYNGYPPLPEFLQGFLWRVTGSLHATGCINILALSVFVYYCHRILKAHFPVVAILCLTAPLVIIHTATTYIDLFGNAFLAIGVTSILAMLLFDRWTDRALLCWGLAGLTIAAWSKLALLPVVVLCFLLYGAVYTRRFLNRGAPQFLFLIFGAVACSSIPYVKNVIEYHNPVWPIKMPVLSDRFPYALDQVGLKEGPPPLAGLSQPAVFVHSILEIGHPTEYPNRERWNIDQGNAWIAFRSGGFWNVAVATALASAVLLGFLFQMRKGWILLGALALLWGFVANLPLSHNLRYFLFLPLTMAAIIGMLLPRVRRDYPAVTLVLFLVFLANFCWMARVNRIYYRVQRLDYRDVAEYWGKTRWWPRLQQGQTYCAVGFDPAAILLTGPTMKEFHIIARTDPSECPPNIRVITLDY